MPSWRQQALIDAPVHRVFFGALGKRYLRRIAEQTIDGLRSALRGSRTTA